MIDVNLRVVHDGMRWVTIAYYFMAQKDCFESPELHVTDDSSGGVGV